MSPAVPPLRTGRASFPASGSSVEKRTLRHAARSHEERPSTLPRRSRQRNRRKPHQQEVCTPPTFLLCFLKSVCQTLHVDQHQREVCRLAPRGDVALRLNPYPAHYRPAFAFSMIIYLDGPNWSRDQSCPMNRTPIRAYPVPRKKHESEGLRLFAGDRLSAYPHQAGG